MPVSRWLSTRPTLLNATKASATYTAQRPQARAMVRPGRVIHSYSSRVPTATVSGGGGGSDVIPTANNFRTAWAYAGVVGGIPARATVFTTLTGAQVTPANIATQLAACPSGQTVKIGPGTFNFSSKITLVNNKTLRGSVDANGVPTTILNCTSGGYSLIDFGSDTYPANGWGSMTVRVLTAAPAKGATSVTLTAAPTGLAVGDVMVIDAPCDEVKVVNSTTIEGGGIWGREGDGTSRTLMQFVKVTAIAGNVVTFANHPLLSDYWTTLGSVKAYWWTASRSTSRFVGLEDLQIRGNYQGDGAIISIVCAENCWVKNVICTGVASSAAGIKPAWSLNCEVRHCSVSDHESVASATYGLWTIYTGQLLAEDNIFFDTPCAIGSMSTSGSVFAYNMGRLFDYQQAGWLPECMMTGHGGHCYANLIEGNNIPSSWHDSFHGNASYCTIARNRLEGWQSDRTSNNQCINLWDNVGHGGTPPKGTGPGAQDRIVAIGNVLGHVGTHTTVSQLHDIESNCALTYFKKGNYGTISGGGILAGEALAGAETIAQSYRYSSRPSWFPASLPWPPCDPANFTQSNNLDNYPAGYRYNHANAEAP